MEISEMLEQIDEIVAKCEGSEIDVMEALEAHSEGWRMRAQELRDDQA